MRVVPRVLRIMCEPSSLRGVSPGRRGFFVDASLARCGAQNESGQAAAAKKGVITSASSHRDTSLYFPTTLCSIIVKDISKVCIIYTGRKPEGSFTNVPKVETFSDKQKKGSNVVLLPFYNSLKYLFGTILGYTVTYHFHKILGRYYLLGHFLHILGRYRIERFKIIGIKVVSIHIIVDQR